MSAPAAEGTRVAWQDVPARVREAIERVCGSPVAQARTQPGGFSPGVAARVRCADGTRWFVKASSAEVNPHTPRLHRQEARVLADLDPLIASGELPVPRLIGTVEHRPWFALVIEDAAGRHPVLPWQDAELDLVLAALNQLAAALTPAPVEVPGITDYLGRELTGWRTLAGASDDDRIDPWARARLDELAAIEATWESHAAGDTLVQGDIRADNLLITDTGLKVVDWPHACRGAVFTDLLLFAPSVAMQGGPEPAELIARSPLGRSASAAAIRAIACALAGYFVQRSLLPPPPGLPTVRQFQAAQGKIACRWLATMVP